jgi:hypothetical protein
MQSTCNPLIEDSTKIFCTIDEGDFPSIECKMSLGGPIYNRNWTTSPRYTAPALTVQKTSVPLLRVLSLPVNQSVHRAAPYHRLLYCRLFTQPLLGNGSTCHNTNITVSGLQLHFICIDFHGNYFSSFFSFTWLYSGLISLKYGSLELFLQCLKVWKLWGLMGI